MWPFRKELNADEYERELDRKCGVRNPAGNTHTPPTILHVAREHFFKSVETSDMSGLLQLYQILNGAIPTDGIREIVEIGQRRILNPQQGRSC